ncbi:hypothetical protein [Variovorax sp. HJSM1_2]|uniref:hypothetical protein n=1 Tax=Variovorax sp. HJSM1_2 TaxID=3366263 RepID=UPI003BCE843F
MPYPIVSSWASAKAAATVAAAALASMLLAVPAAATPVHLTGQSTVGSGPGGGNPYLAAGTVVSADLRFDVSGTTSASGSFPLITQVQGTFSWNDGALRTFNVGPFFLGSSSVSGAMELIFKGTAPVINGLTTELFGFDLNIGTTPYVDGLQWDSLLPGSTITSFLTLIGPPGGGAGRLDIDEETSASLVRVAVNNVPEPGTGWLACMALAGWLVGTRGKRQNIRTA